MAKLARAITDLIRPGQSIIQTGVVVSTGTGTITMTVAGLTDAITVNSPFGGAPAPGDLVLCLVNDGEVIPLGLIAEDGSGTLLVPAELWELDGADDLHPLNTPTTLTLAAVDVVAVSATAVTVTVYETITLDSGSGESTFTMNDSGQMSLFGNEFVIVQGAAQTVIGATSGGVSDSDMPNSSLAFSIDEGADVLNVTVKYSDGTVKIGGIPLT